jgi:exopolysaccharide biosynthesis polyprenyl glycosylphosphotransferase
MRLRPNPNPNLNLLGDCVVLTLAAVFAAHLPLEHGIHWLVALGMAAGSLFLWLVGGRILRHYDLGNGRGIAGDVALTVVLLVATLGPMWLLRFFIPRYAGGSDMFRFVAIVVPGITGLRLLTRWLAGREQIPEPVLIVGTGPLGRHTGLEIREHFANRPLLGYLSFAGEPANRRLPGEVIGAATELEDMLKKHVISEVWLAGVEESNRKEMQECIRTCERFGIPFALPANRFRIARAQPTHPDALRDGYVHYYSVKHKPLALAVKRVFDIASSGGALLMLSPLLIAVAIIIKLTSKGPVLFRQPRVGLQGRPFNMLKFRSMVVNAEELKAKLMALNEQTGPVFKMARDPRITGIGKFIRKYSIDELPQLINVLRGEMSVVGPRPPVPNEVDKYEAWQRRRLSVRPGLTCVWQVSGRNQISFEEWMYLDMQYIDHWSLSQDFSLILKTVPVVLTGRGAS